MLTIAENLLFSIDNAKSCGSTPESSYEGRSPTTEGKGSPRGGRTTEVGSAGSKKSGGGSGEYSGDVLLKSVEGESCPDEVDEDPNSSETESPHLVGVKGRGEGYDYPDKWDEKEVLRSCPSENETEFGSAGRSEVGAEGLE